MLTDIDVKGHHTHRNCVLDEFSMLLGLRLASVKIETFFVPLKGTFYQGGFTKKAESGRLEKLLKLRKGLGSPCSIALMNKGHRCRTCMRGDWQHGSGMLLALKDC